MIVGHANHWCRIERNPVARPLNSEMMVLQNNPGLKADIAHDQISPCAGYADLWLMLANRRIQTTIIYFGAG